MTRGDLQGVALDRDFAIARAFDGDGALPWTPRSTAPRPTPRGPTSAYRVLPGFRLALGSTLFWLGLVVLVPLAAAFARVGAIPWPELLSIVLDPRVVASYRLTF